MFFYKISDIFRNCLILGADLTEQFASTQLIGFLSLLLWMLWTLVETMVWDALSMMDVNSYLALLISENNLAGNWRLGKKCITQMSTISDKGLLHYLCKIKLGICVFVMCNFNKIVNFKALLTWLWFQKYVEKCRLSLLSYFYVN